MLDLITLLATTDALHEPIRSWASPRQVAAVLARRAEFRSTGCPYLAGGSTAERVEANREANQLERSGVVRFHRVKGKRVGWRLTAAEYWRLRDLGLLTGEAELAATMATMLEREADGCVYRGSRLVPEWAIAPRSDRASILLVEESLVPGCVFGWIDSASDSEGRAYYQLTTAGDKWLASFAGPTFARPEYDEAASNAAGDGYLEALIAAREVLAGLVAETSDVAIPLSCGMIPQGVSDA